MKKTRFVFTIIGLSAWTLCVANAAQTDQPAAQPPFEKHEKMVDHRSRETARTVLVRRKVSSEASNSKAIIENSVSGHGSTPGKSISLGAKRGSSQSKLDNQRLQSNRPTLASVGGPALNTRNRGTNPAIIGGSTRSMVKNSAVINGTGMKRKP